MCSSSTLTYTRLRTDHLSILPSLSNIGNCGEIKFIIIKSLLKAHTHTPAHIPASLLPMYPSSSLQSAPHLVPSNTSKTPLHDHDINPDVQKHDTKSASLGQKVMATATAVTAADDGPVGLVRHVRRTRHHSGVLHPTLLDGGNRRDGGMTAHHQRTCQSKQAATLC